MNLDYFIASLPMLLPGQPPRLTVAQFRAACDEQLTGELAAAVRALLDDEDHSHPFVRRWHNYETHLRNAMARRRAARKRISPQPWLRPAIGSDLWLEQGVQAAFDLPDPLQRERAMTRLRWQAIDELEGVQPLTTNVLLAYAIKLRLLEHWSQLNQQLGEQRLQELLQP